MQSVWGFHWLGVVFTDRCGQRANRVHDCFSASLREFETTPWCLRESDCMDTDGLTCLHVGYRVPYQSAALGIGVECCDGTS